MFKATAFIPMGRLLTTDQHQFFYMNLPAKPSSHPVEILLAPAKPWQTRTWLRCHLVFQDRFVAAAMPSEHMAECDHRIMRTEFPDYQELPRESDIKNWVAFFNISYSISICRNFFLLSRISICSGVRRGLMCFSLSLITQQFHPSRHYI